LLTAVALYGAYAFRVSQMDAKGVDVNLLSPYTFSGLLYGAMLPYAFSALNINAVNRVAEEFVSEYREQ
jgi:inorganic pyrophosphatase